MENISSKSRYKILVTGASGQLGRCFQRVSNDWTDFDFIFSDKHDFDITNANQCKKFIVEHNPKVVVNCAAYTAVDKAEDDEENAFLINKTAVGNLVRACKKHGILMMHYSTDYVYHSIENKRLQEIDPARPQGVYARSKYEGEEIIRASSGQSIIIRTSWVYSSYGANFVKTMLRLGKKGIDLKVVGDQIGAPTHALDIAESSMKIIQSILKGEVSLHGNMTLNYTGEGKISWYDFAKYIFDYAKLDVNVEEIDTASYGAASPRPSWSVLDMTKIKSIFGIAPRYWKERTADCIDELEGNKEL